MMEKELIEECVLDEVKLFADKHIRPFAAEFEQNGAVPRDLLNEMAERGYLTANLPGEYGGLGLNQLDYGHFTEIIGKASASVRAILTVHASLVAETLLRWGSKEQKEKFLPSMASGRMLASFALTEPEVGTDAKSVQTTYHETDEHFLLNGTKKWITLGDIADLFLVVASNGEKKTAFLVERSTGGLHTSPLKGLLAGGAEYIAEVQLKDVAVPKGNVLGLEGNGFTYIVNSALDAGRYSIAWGGLGIAQEALDEMIKYSRSRKQFGKSICNFQLIKGIIGNASTNIHAARALCVQVGKLRDTADNNAATETIIAKYFTSQVANKIVSDAVQVHGANGCYNRYPVERLFREAKILEIIEGTSQVLQEVIADFALASR